MASPAYKPMWIYAWQAAGYTTADHISTFQSVLEVNFHLDPCCSAPHCSAVPFLKCSHCYQTMCFQHLNLCNGPHYHHIWFSLLCSSPHNPLLPAQSCDIYSISWRLWNPHQPQAQTDVFLFRMWCFLKYSLQKKLWFPKQSAPSVHWLHNAKTPKEKS